jgi:membrane-bound metal-dependent hydrolase YbcI (DUF457 family)
MYAIGHFALGYLTGKGSSKALSTTLNLPLLLAISVIPDIDLFLKNFNETLFMHRGATHSIITYTILMIPFFVIYRKQAIPYFVALLSHSLIGDIPTGGIEMLWPVSTHWYGNSIIPVGSIADAIAEIALFAIASVIMYKAKDFRELLRPKQSNLFLIIAGVTVLGPLISRTQGSGGGLPLLLLPVSIFWLAIFAYAIILSFRSKSRKAAVIGGSDEKGN